MDCNAVENSCVAVTLPSADNDQETTRVQLTVVRHNGRSKSCFPVFPSDIPQLGDLESASFETALESPTSCQMEGDVSSSHERQIRKPRHRSLDIATLQAVAKSIEIEEILDGSEDVEDEGAPHPMPINELGCYFNLKGKKEFRASPAISVSTADTSNSALSSPMLLPASSSSRVEPSELRLSKQVSVDVETNITSALETISEVDSLSEGAGQEPEENSKKEELPCDCGHEAHYLEHVPLTPIKTCPSVEAGSYEEALSLARAEMGHWVTILERSQSLDSHYKCMGLSYMKRVVMNRLAVPLTFFLEDNNTVIHVHVHTPVGIRHMHGNITGLSIVDNDPDCGKWEGVSSVVDYSIPWFCNGRPVRALRQRRYNEKVGTVLETRCVLPDPVEGRIMLFSFEMHCHKGPKIPITTDRILRFVGKEGP